MEGSVGPPAEGIRPHYLFTHVQPASLFLRTRAGHLISTRANLRTPTPANSKLPQEFAALSGQSAHSPPDWLRKTLAVPANLSTLHALVILPCIRCADRIHVPGKMCGVWLRAGQPSGARRLTNSQPLDSLLPVTKSGHSPITATSYESRRLGRPSISSQ